LAPHTGRRQIFVATWDVIPVRAPLAITDLEQAKNCAKLLQAIAEPNRIRIIECLWDGSKNVTELSKALEVAIVNVSHHLGVLRSAGLVEDKKQGRFVLYSLSPKYFREDLPMKNSLDLGWCQIAIPKT
jgi:ArsR family transcriptional regulator, nickel/cobalt-responsive transcriptional repressor